MKTTETENNAKIYNYSLEEVLGRRFARYSKYIIQDRAIPDVRDGLKPVQRRIIYAMYRDKNTYDKPFKKCAKAVGNVLGNYHPHGDTSVYDALVRMSQTWKQNHTLIHVDGNNGSLDGDPAAAMRYTECRLTKISEELLKDIDKGTVPMVLNYSDTLTEPTVLPAKFPNLLVNGSTGISAGYATNIPPHNLGEIIDATIKRIDSPNCRLDTIMEIVKGPDFPTGAIIEGTDGIRQAFEKGRGKIIISCKYEFVKNKGKEQIIISEIPFEVNKQMLVKKIDDIRIDNKVQGIAEVRDESDKDAMVRIVIDLKANADKNLIMNYLLKNTECQCNYNYNMVAIVNRRPKLLGIIELIDAYIVHLKDVIMKKCIYELGVAKAEINITEGLVKAISVLDDIIKIIRASKNKADAKKNLVDKYNFNEQQVEAIVMMHLYKLSNTDVVELQERLQNLKKIIAGLEAIINDPKKLELTAKEELRKIKKEYATPRKTEITSEVKDISISAEDLIVKENVILVLTKQGYIKKVPMKSYNSQINEETGLKEGDYVINIYEANTIDKMLIITKLGNYIFIPINDIPWGKWKEMGKHISNLVTTNPDDEVIASYIINDNTSSDNIVIFTSDGLVKRTVLSDFIVSRYSKLYTCIKLKDNDYIINACLEKDNTIIVTKTGYYISYKTTEIPTSSVKSSGVKGINLKDDKVVAGLCFNSEDEYLNIFTNQKTAKRIKLADLTQLSRAKRGSMVIKKVKTTNYEVITALITLTKNTIGLTYLEDIGVLKNTDIPIMDLPSTGSAIAKKKYLGAFIFKEIEKIEPATTKKKKEDKKEEPPSKEEQLKFIEDFKL